MECEKDPATYPYAKLANLLIRQVANVVEVVCLRSGFDTLAENHVKEILLKLNLPDHRSILTDLKVTPTKHGRMTKPYSSPRFIANCFNA
nr:hypothetical protein [Tanacetum cinerariifolium]